MYSKNRAAPNYTIYAHYLDANPGDPDTNMDQQRNRITTANALKQAQALANAGTVYYSYTLVILLLHIKCYWHSIIRTSLLTASTIEEQLIFAQEILMELDHFWTKQLSR